MSNLTDPMGGMLNELVEAQRGMTEWEADWYLRTGQLPDLSQPPVAEPVLLTDVGPVGDEAQSREFLAGTPLIASGRRSGDRALTSAAEVHTGAMIALVPTAADAARLAVDGAEPAEQLHVTLGYLGEAALIPGEVQRGVLEAVGYCVADRVSIVGNAFAVAMFNPEIDGDVVAAGREPCVVLLLSGSQLAPFQEYVMRDVGRAFAAAGVQLHPQHAPWVAHLTLAYTADADLSYFTDRVGPVTFDRVRVAFGGEVVDLPLGDTSSDGEE